MAIPSRSYRTSAPGVLAAESAAERARRNGITPPAAHRPIVDEAQPDAPAAPPVIKGAVKVAGFPARSIYPFREIAADGGVWKIDPAAFTWRGKPVRDASVRSAASKWATEHGMKAKVVLDGGMVYVQFTRGGA